MIPTTPKKPSSLGNAVGWHRDYVYIHPNDTTFDKFLTYTGSFLSYMYRPQNYRDAKSAREYSDYEYSGSGFGKPM